MVENDCMSDETNTQTYREIITKNPILSMLALLLIMGVVFSIFFCNTEIICRKDWSIATKTMWQMFVMAFPGPGSLSYFAFARSGLDI